ncbi:hypothetical protein ALC57_01792 [Trachymyrmex cornetzi]|uniref:Uncharacterized protein n=1 Tax=Trachymyrmex cornetzi TaxID=471704 RepID=A0A195ELS3_9HYME|nr:hypothetical protein ALC57_01792 [Trachymyrmex cornetzi]
MNVRTTGPPVPSTEEEPAEMPRVLVFAFEKIEFFASLAHRRCSNKRNNSMNITFKKISGVTKVILITISKKIFVQAMEFQRKVGKVRALGALRTSGWRDTVIFQIHRTRSYTKCPRRCSRVSQDVKRSSICEGEAWNRPAVVFRREAIVTLPHMNDNNCNTMLVNHSLTGGLSERYLTRATRIKYNRENNFAEVVSTNSIRYTDPKITSVQFLIDFVSNELLHLRGCDEEVSLLRRNEALNRCLIVDRPGSLKATRAPYLLSRDEISPKRDRPRFEGSQEASEPERPRGTRGPRPAAMQDRKIPDASSRHPVSVVLPSGRWMTDDRRVRPIFRLNSCESYMRSVLATEFHGSRPEHRLRRAYPPFFNSDTADTIARHISHFYCEEANRPILKTHPRYLIIFLNNFSQHVPVSIFLGAFIGFLARKGIIVRFLVETAFSSVFPSVVLSASPSINRNRQTNLSRTQGEHPPRHNSYGQAVYGVDSVSLEPKDKRGTTSSNVTGHPRRGWPDITRYMSGPRLSPEGETGLAFLAWQGRFFLAFPNALCSSPRVRMYTRCTLSLDERIGIVFAQGVTTARDGHRQVWPQRGY